LYVFWYFEFRNYFRICFAKFSRIRKYRINSGLNLNMENNLFRLSRNTKIRKKSLSHCLTWNIFGRHLRILSIKLSIQLKNNLKRRHLNILNIWISNQCFGSTSSVSEYSFDILHIVFVQPKCLLVSCIHFWMLYNLYKCKSGFRMKLYFLDLFYWKQKLIRNNHVMDL